MSKRMQTAVVVTFVSSVLALACGTSASTADAAPPCDQACQDGIALRSLREGMKRAAKLEMLVAVHAEDDALANKFTAEQKAKGLPQRYDGRWRDRPASDAPAQIATPSPSLLG